MKYDLSTKILNLDEKEMKDENGEPIILRNVLVNALLSEPSSTAGVKKLASYRLAKKVSKGGEMDLTAKEVCDILETVEKAYGALIVGRCYEVLEPTKE